MQRGFPQAQHVLSLRFMPRVRGLKAPTHTGTGAITTCFASVDDCCKGTGSTYRIIVGRSTSVNGPYTDRGGIALTQGGGAIVLSSHGNIIGPGGQTVLNDTDGDILVYHYYDGRNNGAPALGMNKLGWTSDGWPYVQ